MCYLVASCFAAQHAIRQRRHKKLIDPDISFNSILSIFPFFLFNRKILSCIQYADCVCRSFPSFLATHLFPGSLWGKSGIQPRWLLRRMNKSDVRPTDGEKQLEEMDEVIIASWTIGMCPPFVSPWIILGDYLACSCNALKQMMLYSLTEVPWEIIVV